jgi:chemotaxis family two-component system sensor kinase Cph1
MDDVAAAHLNCAQEAIRTPGAIQAHGVLLAVGEADLSVVVASVNSAALFGRDMVGAHLRDVLSVGDMSALQAGIDGDVGQLNPLRVRVRGADVDMVVHRADGLLITEWEPVDGSVPSPEDWQRRLPVALQRLSATDSVLELVDVLAAEVKELTGFDRVMIYRFDRQWDGEVMAEALRPGLEPFLGLHYPAADIPAQARQLYVENWLRIIPDASYTPVPLAGHERAVGGRPLDLSGSFLRSVSPVHLEYLANMGVKSSMSVSLIDDGRLWGLIACHHYAGPHRPSYADRALAEFLGRTCSLLLASKTSAEEQDDVLYVEERLGAAVVALALHDNVPVSALTGPESPVLALLPATGAAACLGGQLHLWGRTPTASRVRELVAGLRAAGVSETDSVVRQIPDADDVLELASGMLVSPIGGGGDFLAWFRPESSYEVSWGGNPTAGVVSLREDGPLLSPRRSFASWTETVRGSALAWATHEVAAANRLASHVNDLTAVRSEGDNRLALALQRTLLLEQMPAVPGVVLAARYRPAAEDVVGGDWYDVIPLLNGNVSFVLGDVAGHGLGAAAITAQIRHGLRAYLLRQDGPAAAVQALNDLIAALLPREMATVIVGELDPVTGSVTLCNAGHLSPLWLTSGEEVFLDGHGPALGLTRDVPYTQTQLTLQGDDQLLLYTDGLVETRSADLTRDLDRLRGAARGVRRHPEELLDVLLAVLDPRPTDDVTMLLVGLEPGSSSPPGPG